MSRDAIIRGAEQQQEVVTKNERTTRGTMVLRPGNNKKGVHSEGTDGHWLMRGTSSMTPVNWEWTHLGPVWVAIVCMSGRA